MKARELRGHPLSSADFKKGRALTTDWRGKIQYAFDPGAAIGKFLAGLKDGKLFGRKCHKCRRVVIPPRMFCERCFRPNDEWVELKDTGRINTFSVSFVNWDASRRNTPQVPAVIDIDGATKGMGILHLVSEVGDKLEEVLARVKIGLRVQAVWKPANEREGSITDILYFRPIEK
jgi:uncharacterized OB-fold protein